jgi:iron complex outermembrane receptor protein
VSDSSNLESAVFLSQPKQTLLKSLIHLGQKSDISIIAPSVVIRGLAAPPLEGQYTPKQALGILLENSGLFYQEVSAKVVAIKPIENIDTSRPSNSYILEEVSVIGRPITGSRLKRLDVEGSAAVDIISGNDIAISGSQTLGEFLKYVPSVSGNSTSTSVSNGGDGSASVTLRGMPANNTLVLLNGKRFANKGLRGDAADLNSIPPSAIERVEILKDGASSIYGSDAIAGVVNIIMKSDFDGLKFDQYFGRSSRGDLETRTTNFLWGATNLSSSILVAASYSKQDGLLSQDRSLSNSADASALGGADLRSSATAETRISLPNGDVVSPNLDGSFSLANDENLFDYALFTSTISPSKHENIYINASHNTEDNLFLRMTLGYTSTDAEITFAPTPIFTAFERTPITVSANQIYNPFGVDITDIRRRLVELPLRTQEDDTENWRFGISADSIVGNYNWQVSANWSQAQSYQTLRNVVVADRLRKSLSADCLGPLADGCVPLNVFGPSGSIDQHQLDYISTYAQVEGTTHLYQYNMDIDTSIPFNSAYFMVATGLELRKEKVDTGPVNHAPGAELIGGDDVSQTVGSRTITEFYVETQTPLARRQDLAHSMDLEVSVRASRYSDFGTSINPKLGFRYRPVRDILLRATYAEGFRAPSISELHREGSFDLPFLNDPCTQIDNVGVLPGCTQLADETRFQFVTEFVGDDTLKPETSKSYTVGTVWTPSETKGLSLSASYFNISQENVVDANAQFLVDHNAFYDVFSDQVIRDEYGNIAKINAPFMNLGNREVRGVDLAFSYQWESGRWGNFRVTSNASHLIHFSHQVLDQDEIINEAGTFSDEASQGSGSLPDWKINSGLKWAVGPMELNYTLHYVSKLQENIPESSRVRSISSALSHDIQMNYQPRNHKALSITIGADNLFDTQAPFSAAAFNDNYDSRTHDIRGQFWYGRLSYDFY